MNDTFITVSVEGNVGIIELNRPHVLNALNLQMVEEIVAALEAFDRDQTIRCMVITGQERAFAAGADIEEMAHDGVVSMLVKDQFAVWDRISLVTKPIIAAVSGFALGGGCELMMSCDIVIASETARIGQPEVKLGVMPGAGGTQRLTKAVGKLKAMEMLLTGEPITAHEALQYRLVNRVVPAELCRAEALKTARRIADMPPLAVRLIKKSVVKAVDATTTEGLEYERNCFYLLFASEDKAEGMNAFIEKRKPNFTGQ
ncbi:short chain enoyl-CoA hydratase [Aneurinibacillus soli]|uniref:Putative enoyl-CoA hydratase echA8 n=1 Tax=Aneurinibacillus soli TaxID=1500254 RepID=A0A0U5BGS1_9BACL|nr:enoyl-CoA hydratase-related protein [Aneurinibacillus soli]PYE58487.1 short chain enoyl-CoA hydratase [Aneurinibacillus soli]BAU29463.1 putative enoyl-CoA hydratase echA8 [Aneurinibacillus soli]